MKTKLFAVLALFMFGVVLGASAQKIIGKWKTIDDETGKAKSIVKIYKGNHDGLIYGKIETLYREPGEDQNPVCENCKGSLKNKPIKGMIIIRAMKKKGDKWVDGTILDPGNGKTYDCKMWLEGGKLQVRGYLGWSALGRSQTWLPYKD